MSRENIRKWVDALRSGEYEQGKNCLAQETENKIKYCCLGVACELAYQENFVDKVVIEAAHGQSSIFYGASVQSGCLPIEVMRWLEVDANDPYIHVAGDWLSALNDEGLTFNNIADLIEVSFLDGE